MRFFAYVALAAAASAIDLDAFSDEEKEALFEVWTSQTEAGLMDEETYFELAQALDGDLPDEWYAEVDSIADEIEIPAEFLQTDIEEALVKGNKEKVDPKSITEKDVEKIVKKMANGEDATKGAG